MRKGTTWLSLGSLLIAIVVSPFIASLISNLYIHNAESDDSISKVFEISTLVLLPIVFLIVFISLRKLVTK